MYDNFYSSSKLGIPIMKALMMYLNQSILQLIETHQNLWEKVHAGLFIQPLIILLVF